MGPIANIMAGAAAVPEGGAVSVELPESTDRAAAERMKQRTGDGADAAITDLFHRYASRVYGYARLRSAPDMAEEVVADTFLTAWRLRDRIPDDPLPWLLVIARNALSNRHRSAARSTRLAVRTAAVEQLAAPASAAEDTVVDRQSLLAAVALLTDEEREALVLTAWDGLSNADAARVAGCAPRTLTRRLRRARHHLNRALITSPAAEQAQIHAGRGQRRPRPSQEQS